MKTRMELEHADRVAKAIVAELEPACRRVEVAGSIRRRDRVIGDVEILAIPQRLAGLFGDDDGASLLDQKLAELIDAGRLASDRPNRGERYRQYLLPRVRVSGCEPARLDLFIVRPETWGVQMMIRTGPDTFSQRMVTRRCEGGLLPDELRVDQGRVWHGRKLGPDGIVVEPGEPLDTPEEFDVFDLVGRWWPPQDRGRSKAGGKVVPI